MTHLLKRFTTSSLLLAGALVGLTLGACDPKMIGDETKGDKDCKEGEQMPSEDGCNTCTCTDGGWACTEKACGDPTGDPTGDPSGDPSGDPPVCEDGDSKPADDGCNNCTCYDGQWACTEIACGDECQPGDKKMDECNTCDCYMGGWVCTDAACPGTDTDGDTEPGSDTIDPTAADPVCGDGVVDGNEFCDDGNQVDDDRCPNDCGLGDNACGASDPLTIDSAMIAGDALVTQVTYGGGCQEHLISLCWDDSFAESDPVQAWIGLSHDAQDDECDALITEMRSIDLSPLREAYQAGYQTENGEIILHLDGWDGSLLYSF